MSDKLSSNPNENLVIRDRATGNPVDITDGNILGKNHGFTMPEPIPQMPYFNEHEKTVEAIENLQKTTIELSNSNEQTQQNIRDLTKLAIILAFVQLFIVLYPMYLRLLSIVLQ